LDIVGGTVGSLNEAYREATTFDATGHWVNLLFDHETDSIQVKSPYTHESLEVTLRKASPLFVRIPPWVDRKKIRIEGESKRLKWHGAYLCFPCAAVGKPISIHFPLEEQEITLAGSVHINPIRVRMRGDEVVAMESFGANLTYFDAISK
jgi:hypothetical protein